MTQESVEELYKKWYKPVRSWLRRRGNIPKLWIDDIAQEVFIRLLKYDPEINTNTIGYVFRITSNVACEWTDRAFIRKNHGDLDSAGEHALGVIASPEEILEEAQYEQDRLLKIEQAMSKLPSRQLLVLMLHIYDKKTYKEVAKELGLTYRIVLRDLTRAYTFLRFELKELADTFISSEEMDDGRDNDRAAGEAAVFGSDAGVRVAASHVGAVDGIPHDGAANERILDSCVNE